MTEGGAEAAGAKQFRAGQPWTREKLDLLRYYLGGTGHKGGGFAKATQKAGGAYYIDLFSGPGQVRLEDGTVLEGSPLIAAQVTPPFTRLFWVDANAPNAASLRSHRADFPGRVIDVIHGDANGAIASILAAIPRTQPALAFLDPEGSELSWETVRRISEHKRAGLPRIEQFVLFATDTGITRFFPHDAERMANEVHLDRMLPHPSGWRELYTRRDDLTTAEWRRELLGLYTQGLRDLGYAHVPPPRQITDEAGRPLYFMVFATDHPAGDRIMTSAFNRVQPTRRQTTFLPYHERY